VPQGYGTLERYQGGDEAEDEQHAVHVREPLGHDRGG